MIIFQQAPTSTLQDAANITLHTMTRSTRFFDGYLKDMLKGHAARIGKSSSIIRIAIIQIKPLNQGKDNNTCTGHDNKPSSTVVAEEESIIKVDRTARELNTIYKKGQKTNKQAHFGTTPLSPPSLFSMLISG